MCESLKISRCIFYYKIKFKTIDSELENTIVRIFNENRKVYGTRRIKKELEKIKDENQAIKFIISRKSISKVMKKHQIMSKYTELQYKKHGGKTNYAEVGNIVDRKFNNRKNLEVLVSDLTYVRVANSWHYICFITNLYNRAIVGFAVGENKDSQLVYQAFMNSKINLSRVGIFHTDRGSEFKNTQIDELLSAFKIKRSLSRKGNPWDNAVAEALYKILKTEFVSNKIFSSKYQLERELTDYINWYNKKRLHSSLGYVPPLDYVA